MRYHIVLFDLDGTLIDTKPGILKSARETLRMMGATPPPDSEFEKFLGPPIKQCFTDVCGLSPEDAEKAVSLYRRHLVESGNVYDCAPFAGIPELLQALKKAGCRLGVATSKAQHLAVTVLAHTGLTGYFDAICGPDGQNPGATKADSIRFALSCLGAGADGPAVLAGDRCYDAQGAAQTGIDSIGVYYGYGERWEIEESAFTLRCETVEDLKTSLLA